MFEIKKINNWSVTKASTLTNIRNEIYGYNDYTFNRIIARLEVCANKNFLDLPLSKWLCLLMLLQHKYPQSIDVQKKTLANIFMLDILGTYKGWRHIKGLPVRGQRTWTNGKSASKSNLTLRKFKLQIAKKIYGRLPAAEVNTAYLAEQINLVWKVQWEQEWKAAKKSRLRLSRQGGIPKADIFAMAKGHVVSPQKLKKMNKKQKQALKKNSFSLGFDLGFTKKIVDDLYKQKATEQSKRKSKRSELISLRDEKKKIKVKKKKIDIKTQKIKHALKKKSKKSAWD